MPEPLSRRRLLAAGAASGLGLPFALQNSRSVHGAPANDKVNVALVGVSGRGRWFVNTLPRMASVVALCDVNDQRAAEAFKKIPSAKRFRDFRVMLNRLDREIDAICVAVPDHNHGIISATAMKMGKHVLCEKPLTHNVLEARTLTRYAAKYKVATQMGNQGTASRGFRRAVELIQAGVLGEVREVHAWNTGGGPGARPLPKGSQPVPKHLAWDVWLGPAADRPFHQQWLRWHGWRGFATGQLGNWGCHTMNVIFKGLKLDALWRYQPARQSAPYESAQTEYRAEQAEHHFAQTIAIKAEVSGKHAHTFPRWEIVRYKFPPRAGLPSVTLNWYNGGGRAPGPRKTIEQLLERRLDWGDAGAKKWQDHAGCLLVGDKGMLHATGHNTSFTLLPAKTFKDFQGPPSRMPKSRGHEQEWLDDCRGGAKSLSSFDYAGPLTEFVLLGNVATLFDHEIIFDPMAMKVANSDEADKALRRTCRPGWSL